MIYLDNAATSPPDKSILEQYKSDIARFWYNPSANYSIAYENKKMLEEARNSIIELLDKKDGTVIFTSGGTEANNLAITGWAMANKRAKNNRILTSNLEHPSSLLPASAYDNTSFINITSDGMVDLESIKKHEDVGFISCMAVNNEVGSVQPTIEIAEYAIENNIIFHCDAVQAVGKMKLPDADLISLSAHKLGGPKGIGALYISPRARILPILLGGGQEKGLRSGTESVANALCLMNLLKKHKNIDNTSMQKLYDRLKNILLENTSCELIESKKQSPYIMAVHFPNIMATTLQNTLAMEEINIGVGSACSSNTKKPSKVMEALGKDKKFAQETIRISFSKDNTIEEIEHAGNKICEYAEMLEAVKR